MTLQITLAGLRIKGYLYTLAKPDLHFQTQPCVEQQ